MLFDKILQLLPLHHPPILNIILEVLHPLFMLLLNDFDVVAHPAHRVILYFMLQLRLEFDLLQQLVGQILIRCVALLLLELVLLL